MAAIIIKKRIKKFYHVKLFSLKLKQKKKENLKKLILNWCYIRVHEFKKKMKNVQSIATDELFEMRHS